MSNGRVIVKDSELKNIMSVYGTDVFKILAIKKAEGLEIIFTDDFGNPHSGFDPMDLR